MKEQWFLLAHVRTVLLAVGFLISVLVLSLAVSCCAQLFAYGIWIHNPTQELGPEYAALNPLMWSPVLFALVMTAAVPLIFFGSAYKIRQLKNGLGPLLLNLDARLVEDEPTEDDEKTLHAIVVEVCGIANVPVPHIVILDQEHCINAFTLGTPGIDAVLGVTGGAMSILKPEQLRALVAHQVSYLLHGDSIVHTRMAGVLNGLLIVEFVGLFMASRGTGVGEDGEPRKGRLDMLIPGFALIVLGFPGSFCARLIKLLLCRAASKQADAVVVDFCGQSDELVGLLKRVGALRQQSFMQNPNSELLSQCFFATPQKRLPIFDAFSITLPLAARIRRWQPDFDGKFIPIRQTRKGLAEILPDGTERLLADDGQPVRASAAEVVHEKPPENPIPSRTKETREAAAMAAVAAAAVEAGQALPVEQAAEPITARNSAPAVVRIERLAEGLRLLYPDTLLEQLPAKLRELAGNPNSAQAILMAMLLAEKHKLREEQLRHIATINDPSTQMETLSVARMLEKLPRPLRLTMAEIASSGIRQLVAEEYALFRENIDHLLATRDQANTAQGPFFFALEHVVFRALDAFFSRLPKETPQLNGVSPERLIAAAVGAFAYLSAERQAQIPLRLAVARESLQGGHEVLDSSAGPVVFSAEMLDNIMAHLATATDEVRQAAIEGCLQVATDDERITLQEAELLRAMAASLRVQLALALAPPAQTSQPAA